MLNNLVQLDDIQLSYVLSHFFVSERILYDDIQKLYEKNELKYYQIGKKVAINFNEIYQKYPYAKAKQMKMCFGVCYDWIQNLQLYKLYPLCKKSFKFSWNYIETNRRFDGKHFLLKWTKKYPMEHYPLQYLLKSYYIAAMLSEIKGYSIQYDDIFAPKVIEYIENVLEEYTVQSLPVIEYEHLEAHNQKLTAMMKKIEESSTLFEGFRVLFLEAYEHIDPISHQIMGKCYCNHCIKTKEDYMKAEQILYEKVIRQGNGQWLKTFDFLFQIIGLDAPSFTANTKVDQKQLQDFLYFLEEVKQAYHLSEDMYIPFFFFYLYLLSFYSDYKQVRERFYDYLSHGAYLSEIEKYKQKENMLVSQKKNIEKKYQALQKENQYLKQLVEEMRDEVRIAHQSFNKQLDEREDFSKEVHALRAYLVEMNDSKEDVVPVLELKKIQALKKRRIVIVGGSYQWQKKLKQAISTLDFIYTDDYLKQQDLLKKSEYVFINTTVLSHKSYHKIMEIINKNQIQLFYLKGHRNVDLSISEIYDCIYQKK